MATKAQLEVELNTLKAELATLHGGNNIHETKIDAVDEPSAGELSEENQVLHDGSGVEDLWAQLFHELEGLPQKKPLLAVAGALAVGFILGRVSK